MEIALLLLAIGCLFLLGIVIILAVRLNRVDGDVHYLLVKMADILYNNPQITEDRTTYKEWINDKTLKAYGFELYGDKIEKDENS